MLPLEQPLDILTVAPHPDDAEISVGGTLVTCRRQGLRVGVLDLTNGEPTPHGSPWNTLQGNRRGDQNPAIGLAAQSGSAESNARTHAASPTFTRHDLSIDAASRDSRALLGRQPSGSCRGHQPDRSGAVLVQVDSYRYGGRTVPSAADFLLLQHPFAYPSAACIRVRYQRGDRTKARIRSLLRKPVHHWAQPGISDTARRHSRSSPLLGLVDRVQVRRTICQSRVSANWFVWLDRR